MKYLFGAYCLDTERQELREGTRVLQLGPVAYAVLRHLIENRARLVFKSELHREVWRGRSIAASTIPTVVSGLRRSLGDDIREPRIIESVYGRGYRFLAETRELIDDSKPLRAGLQHLADLGRLEPLVGRRKELRLLESLASDIGALNRLVVVTGEAGVGKTRLIEHLAVDRASKGEAVLLARCSEVDGAPPYGPWIDILDQLESVPGFLQSDVSPRTSAVLRQFRGRLPSDQQVGDALEAGSTGRFRVLEAVEEVAAVVSAAVRIIVVVDDFHRADPGSVAVLSHLLRSRTVRGVFVVALRDAAQAPGLGEVCRHPETVEIRLGRLTRSEAAELVQRRISIDSDSSLIDRVYELTGGNPFFVGKLTDLIVAKGTLEPLKSEGKCELPRATRDAILQHIAGLPEDSQEVLRRAAVLGREADPKILREMMRWDSSRFANALRHAIEAGVLGDTGVLRFAHVLLRDALYDDTRSDATCLHAQAFSAIEKVYGVVPGNQLASWSWHGVIAGNLTPPRERARACSAAGEWARGRFAFAAAARHFQDALDAISEETPPDKGTCCSLLVAIAECQQRSNQRADGQENARRALALAREIDAPEAMARACLAYAPGFFAIEVGVVDVFLVEALEETRTLLTGTSSVSLLAQVTARLAMALCWTSERDYRGRVADEAVGIASKVGGSTSAYAMTARALALWDPAGPEEKEEVARNALRLALDAGEHEMELVYRVYRIASLLQIGNFFEAKEEIEAFRTKAVRVGDGNSLWFVDLFRAMLAMVAGRSSVAAEATDAFVRAGRLVGDRNADHCRVVHRVYQRMEFGPIGDAEEIAREQWKKYQRVGAYRCSLPFLLYESGEVLAARVSFEEIARRGFESVPRNVEWLIGMAMLAEGCAVLGDRRRAETLYGLLLPHSGECVVVGFGVAVFRPVAYFLGRLATTMGRYREGEAHFSTSLRVAATFHSRPWLAHTQFGLAELLVRRGRPGDKDRARQLLASCGSVCEELQMRPLGNRVLALARLLRDPT